MRSNAGKGAGLVFTGYGVYVSAEEVLQAEPSTKLQKVWGHPTSKNVLERLTLGKTKRLTTRRQLREWVSPNIRWQRSGRA